MSTALLVVLTVVEIVALVVVLALFVIAITGAGAAILIRKRDVIAAALPAIAEKAESLPSQQVQIPQQSRTETSGGAWRPAIAQDPMIKP